MLSVFNYGNIHRDVGVLQRSAWCLFTSISSGPSVRHSLHGELIKQSSLFTSVCTRSSQLQLVLEHLYRAQIKEVMKKVMN